MRAPSGELSAPLTLAVLHVSTSGGVVNDLAQGDLRDPLSRPERRGGCKCSCLCGHYPRR